jgi:hypothetical protein
MVVFRVMVVRTVPMGVLVGFVPMGVMVVGMRMGMSCSQLCTHRQAKLAEVAVPWSLALESLLLQLLQAVQHRIHYANSGSISQSISGWQRRCSCTAASILFTSTPVKRK